VFHSSSNLIAVVPKPYAAYFLAAVTASKEKGDRWVKALRLTPIRLAVEGGTNEKKNLRLR